MPKYQHENIRENTDESEDIYEKLMVNQSIITAQRSTRKYSHVRGMHYLHFSLLRKFTTALFLEEVYHDAQSKLYHAMVTPPIHLCPFKKQQAEEECRRVY